MGTRIDVLPPVRHDAKLGAQPFEFVHPQPAIDEKWERDARLHKLSVEIAKRQKALWQGSQICIEGISKPREVSDIAPDRLVQPRWGA